MPESEWMPKIIRTSAVPDITSVTLSADFKDIPLSRHRAGFYYGMSGGVLQKVPGNISGKTVQINVSGLIPETEYVFKAYVSNGRQEACSQQDVFTTFPLPQEPDLPTEPEPQPEFEVLTTDLTISSAAKDIYVEISGNVDYEVIIPEDAGWVECTSKAAQRCALSVSMNLAQDERSCEIVFSSLKHDCRHVVTLTQQAMV